MIMTVPSYSTYLLQLSDLGLGVSQGCGISSSLGPCLGGLGLGSSQLLLQGLHLLSPHTIHTTQSHRTNKHKCARILGNIHDTGQAEW